MRHSPFEKELDMDWVRKNSVIIHYCGRNKPWKSNYVGQLGRFYLETASRLEKEALLDRQLMAQEEL